MRLVTVGLSIGFLAFVAGCVSQSVVMVHPQSGATANCDASGFGSLALAVDAVVEECIKRVEGQGYVPVDKLTAEQRADLERRGVKIGR
jgi:hypothetical protein